MHRSYEISKQKNQCPLVVVVFVIMFIGFLSSCRDVIDPAAANSLSAVFAVIGEYIYAIIALILVVILWILRPVGISLAVLGMLGICNIVELSINSSLLICIGIVLFIASFAPIHQYEPLVIISKHFKMPKKEIVREKHNIYQELFVQLIVGILILIVEYSVFAR